MITVAITGHRPERIPDLGFARESLAYAYYETNASFVIQGMAAGIDLLSAKVAFKEGISFGCARPWAGHQPRKEDKVDYDKAIRHAKWTVDVDPSETYAGPWVYQRRNEYMVDNADMVIAFWDGSTSGGTFNCVEYAKRKKKEIYQINPLTKVSEYIA
jgi:uncharacterized phage-like protein YoqJ